MEVILIVAVFGLVLIMVADLLRTQWQRWRSSRKRSDGR